MATPVTTASLLSLGGRSPLVKVASTNLRRGFYATVSFILLIIIAFVATAQVQRWQRERQARLGLGRRVVTISYAQLGPPPSILENEAAQAASAAQAAPVVGVPKPVPDELAQQETAPTQTEITGATPVVTGGELAVDTLPPINAYIPHEVEPQFVSKPPFIYPEVARQLGMEGTVYAKALINLDGGVMKVVVLKSSGYPVLDTAGVDYLSRCRFSPALQQHKPVRVWVGVPVIFTLGQR